MNRDYDKVELDLKSDGFTISGFSSGGFLASNILALFNEFGRIDGAALFGSGGPCATRGFCTDPAVIFADFDFNAFDQNDPSTYPQPKEVVEVDDKKQWSTAGLDGLPIYLFSGANDLTAFPEYQDA